MAVIEVLCPVCKSNRVVSRGRTSNGKQQFECRNVECGKKTFLLEYTYNACKYDVKEKILEMATSARGVRDTARVLNVSPKTVISTLKSGALHKSN